jgi:cytochrome c-type biogenesis protein CcmH/NrfG
MLMIEMSVTTSNSAQRRYGMDKEPVAASIAGPSLQPIKVYMMAVTCLLIGLAIGYLFLGAHQQQPASPKQTDATSAMPFPNGNTMGSGHAPNLEDMKRMADKKAAPLIEGLKHNPSDSALLMQIGSIYHSSHQFREAAAYFDKAVQADPKNVALRTKLAASLYRSGDVDGAIAQLNRALSDDPKDANALFNLGMIKLQGKQDGTGALAAWQRLLKANPHLSADRKAQVQKLMAGVLTMLGDQHGRNGAGSSDRNKSSSN